MATAADDALIRRNPCMVKGAGTEHSPERPVLTVAQVYALAEAAGPRYRALVLLACFCGLRWGELAALRRCDIDTGQPLFAWPVNSPMCLASRCFSGRPSQTRAGA